MSPAARLTGRTLGVALFGLVVLGPLLALVPGALRVLAESPAEAIALAVPRGGRALLLGRSIALSGLVAAAALAIGAVGASLLWRRTGLLGRARWLVLVLVPVPAYLHALAWSSMARRWTLGDASPVPAGFGAAWWVQTMALAPLAVGLGLVALDRVPDEMVEAARVAGTDDRALLRIALPLARPVLVAGAALIFLVSLLDYSVPALFQVNVYSLALFAEYSARSDAGRALWYAVPLMAAGLTAVAATQGGWRRAAQRPARHFGATPLGLTGPVRVLQLAAVAVLALQILVPGAVLAQGALVPGGFAAAARTAAPELVFSFAVALSAGAVALPVSAAAAGGLAGHRAGRAWWPSVAVPLSVPAALAGVGLIMLWNSVLGGRVYGTVLMPVLAAVARFAPVAALVIAAELRRSDPALIDAAVVHQRSRLQTLLRVRLPLLAPSMLAAAALVFALSLGELGATLLVAPPGRSTLAIKIYNYLHYGASDVVAALSLLLALGAAGAGGLAAVALAGGRRLMPGS